jgi:integrase
MDSICLHDVTAQNIQQLISKVLERGYSIQTVTHIRNVIRAIFAHAKDTGAFDGKNPASFVTLPDMAREEPHTLTLEQLKRVIRLMRYPEREIALLAIFTDLSVAEICGLQWKYVNLSHASRIVDGDWLSSRTIAVRKQSYRGEFSSVVPSRQRNLPMPDLICSVLSDLRARQKLKGPEEFVFPSRSGTPINQDNVAIRRLKAIGKALAMPWLSWSVFHRTHTNFFPAGGRYLQTELKEAITLQWVVVRRQ